MNEWSNLKRHLCHMLYLVIRKLPSIQLTTSKTKTFKLFTLATTRLPYSFKPWSQPTVRVFSPYVFLGGHVRYVFLKTLGGSGKSREGVRHTQGVSTWPARHAGRERLRASYVAHVVSELYVLTTCLQRTISL